MNPIFKKLNFKDQDRMLILNAPESFQTAMTDMAEECKIDQKPVKNSQYRFIMVFVEDEKTLFKAIDGLKGQYDIEKDPLLWIAYPKKSSKKYQSDIHRDSKAWFELGKFGFEGVRQIAIDEDWSALRFRHVNFIRTMKRDKKRAMSEKGQKRTK